MTRTRVANVQNGLLSADAPGPRQTRTNRRRSTSLAPSSGSELSRVTLVENDPELTADHNSKSDNSYEIITCDSPKYTWLNHLRGVFCLSLSKKDNMRKEYRRAKTPVRSVNDQDLSTWPSPWILPVYVYQNRGNKGSETVPKVGKCTIDTGNLQGNIVSREFVERVLECSPEMFRELTQEEKRGGTGITGDLHVPEGAIYLTWYHKNSTRVFRDMRFLISPHSDCDLIIGARSIQKDGILNVPCLMTDNRASNVTKINRGTNQEPNPYQTFHIDRETQENRLQKKRNAILSLAKKDVRKELQVLIPEYASLMIDNEFYSLAKHIYDALNADMSNENRLIHAKPPWDKLWALKNNEGHLPNSQAVREESESIRQGLPTKALNSPEDFGEVWQKLASMYPLSKELQEKLDNVNGLLYPFWDQLQGKYRDCERNY